MSEEKILHLGIIGLGGISHAHTSMLAEVKNAKIVALCDIDEQKLKARGEELGVPEEYRFTDYKALIACPEVDAVEVCTPNVLHPEMAVEAIRAKKPVNIEKPIGISYGQSKCILEEQEKFGTPAMVCFSYRFRPAVRYAKHLLDKKAIGEIMGVNVQYFKSSGLVPGRRLEWRFIKEYAGSGVLGDLGVHLIDMVTYLLGDITEVCGTTDILVKRRPLIGSDGIGEVTTDDACNFVAVMADGKTANFGITRCALGNANTIKYQIFGSEGVLEFNLNDPTVLGVCIGEVDRECQDVHFVKVPKSYYLNQEQNFVNIALGLDVPTHPSVADGLKCQKILDAVLLSAEERRFVKVE